MGSVGRINLNICTSRISTEGQVAWSVFVIALNCGFQTFLQITIGTVRAWPTVRWKIKSVQKIVPRLVTIGKARYLSFQDTETWSPMFGLRFLIWDSYFKWKFRIIHWLDKKLPSWTEHFPSWTGYLSLQNIVTWAPVFGLSVIPDYQKTFNYQKTLKLNRKHPKLNKKPPKLNRKMKVNAGSWADYEEIPILGDDFKSYQMPVMSFILHNVNSHDWNALSGWC